MKRRQVAQVIKPLRMSLLQFPQKSLSRTTSKWLAKIVQPQILLQPGLLLNCLLSHHTETAQDHTINGYSYLSQYVIIFQFSQDQLEMPFLSDSRK